MIVWKLYNDGSTPKPIYRCFKMPWNYHDFYGNPHWILYCFILYREFKSCWHGMDMYSAVQALWGGIHQSPMVFSLQRDSYVACVHYLFVDINNPLNKELNCQWYEIPWCSCGITVMVRNTACDKIWLGARLKIWTISLCLARDLWKRVRSCK